MNIKQSLKEIRDGFHRTFWVANIMELFERLAYYGQQIVFVVYLKEKVGFTVSQATQISGVFGFALYLLPMLGGTLADKWGYRRAFNVAFSILALGYFLIGSIGMDAFAGAYGNFNLYWLMIAFVLLTAFGGHLSSRQCSEPLQSLRQKKPSRSGLQFTTGWSMWARQLAQRSPI